MKRQKWRILVDEELSAQCGFLKYAVQGRQSTCKFTVCRNKVAYPRSWRRLLLFAPDIAGTHVKPAGFDAADVRHTSTGGRISEGGNYPSTDDIDTIYSIPGHSHCNFLSLHGSVFYSFRIYKPSSSTRDHKIHITYRSTVGIRIVIYRNLMFYLYNMASLTFDFVNFKYLRMR